MKYMLMLFGGPDQMTANTSPEWVREMGKFMMDLDMELRQTGEIVQSIGLADPTSAKTIRMQENGPVTTDGPFAEYKESLAGYWLLVTGYWNVMKPEPLRLSNVLLPSLEGPWRFGKQ